MYLEHLYMHSALQSMLMLQLYMIQLQIRLGFRDILRNKWIFWAFVCDSVSSGNAKLRMEYVLSLQRHETERYI